MIYFDNASTTKVIEEVKDIAVKYMCEEFANPSSSHIFGSNVLKFLKNAKLSIANDINASYENIIFTSGATESNNLVIQSFISGNKNDHFITTNFEHSSVFQVFKYLENLGYKVDYVPCDKDGFIDICNIIDLVNENTKLISIMNVNNEVGSILDIKNLRKKLDEINYKGYLHTDATQYIGKFRINLEELGIDFLSVSGHKFHSPKGVGFLYAKNKKLLKPLFYGGGQQDNYRSGTLNVSNIMAMAKALQLATKNIDESYKKVNELKNMLKDYCKKNNDKCYLISKDDRYSPYINSIIFYDIKPEVLVHSLEQKKIYVSSSSACSSKVKVSNTMKAMFGENFKHGIIRVSLSELNTENEMIYFLKSLDEILPNLLKYMKK